MVYLRSAERLRGDERGLHDLLAEGSAGAHDGRRPQPLAQRRWADRDLDGGRARTAASASSSTRASGSKSPNPYSYGIKSGNTLFLSGLVSRNGKDNTTVKGDITTQTKTVLDNGAAILKAAGMSFADVVVVAHLPHRRHDVPGMNTAYRTYFPTDAAGARDRQGRADEPRLLVEITMVAVKDAGRKAITTPNADGTPGTANPNLSSAIQVGNRLYVAGISRQHRRRTRATSRRRPPKSSRASAGR